MKRIASVVLSLFVAAIASAQVRESVSVEVVQVPVYVSTYNGVVTGLTRDNFRLFVNGKSQAIDYFDVVDFSTINVPEEERLDPRQRRLYLLVFDLLFSTPIAIARAQVAVDRLLTRAGRSDEFSVATYRHNRGIELLVPFTRDRGAIRRAVQTLKPSGTSDVLRLAVNPEETEALTQGIEFDESEASSNPTNQLAGADEEMLHQPLKNLIEDQIANLASIGQRLAPLEGQKHVVLLSTGFSSRMVHGVGAQTNPGNLRTMSADPLTARMSLPHPVKDEIDARLARVLQALDSEYAAAGVFLDAIDIAGLRPGGLPTENEGLVMLARDTGGDLIEKRNNLAEALEVLTDRQRVVYVLGFHARNTHREQNSIESPQRQGTSTAALSPWILERSAGHQLERWHPNRRHSPQRHPAEWAGGSDIGRSAERGQRDHSRQSASGAGREKRRGKYFDLHLLGREGCGRRGSTAQPRPGARRGRWTRGRDPIHATVQIAAGRLHGESHRSPRRNAGPRIHSC